MHFYAWKAGLKTGMYYLRSRPATDAIAFTVDPSLIKAANAAKEKIISQADVSAPQVAKRSSVTTEEQAAKHVADLALNKEGVSPQASPLASPKMASRQETKALAAQELYKDTVNPLAAQLAATDINSKVEESKEADAEKDALSNMTPEERRAKREYEEAKLQCSIKNREACEMCSG